jgi:hypothetical protein
MKKIILLSDTHSALDERFLPHLKGANEIWHAGDIGDIKLIDKFKLIKPFRGVFGNIDDNQIRKELPLNNIFTCEEVKVWITHIGGYPGKYKRGVSENFESKNINLFISGHSHILKIIYDKKNNLLHMNPGAIGKHGFHNKRTMIRFEIDKKVIENVEVIEFDR